MKNGNNVQSEAVCVSENQLLGITRESDAALGTCLMASSWHLVDHNEKWMLDEKSTWVDFNSHHL